MQAKSGAGSAILAQQVPSLANVWPPPMDLPNGAVRASEEQVMMRVIVEQIRAAEHADGVGMLGTHAGDNARVLTDGFLVN